MLAVMDLTSFLAYFRLFSGAFFSGGKCGWNYPAVVCPRSCRTCSGNSDDDQRK